MKIDPRAPGAICDDDEIAVKSFFLGPSAENGDWLRERLLDILGTWFESRQRTSAGDGLVIPPAERSHPAFLQRQAHLEETAAELAHRFESELPKYSPRYMGHMFSELSMPALLGHFVALLHNPNNISRESSTVGLEIEREAIRMLLSMFGVSEDAGTGHFTSGGTLANFEAVLRARTRQKRWIALGAFLHETTGAGPSLFEAAHMGWDAFHRNLDSSAQRREFTNWSEALLHSETFVSRVEAAYGERWVTPAMIVSSGTHYSWIKAAEFFGIPREAIAEVALDEQGRLDLPSLRTLLKECADHRRPVMLLVTIAGSTELGTVDPIDQVCNELRLSAESWKSSIWHHVDAAFGGFFACLKDEPQGPIPQSTLAHLQAIHRATSITVDPHKLGYVPYASGVFLCTDRRDYAYQQIDAPYIDFDQSGDPGLQTIEGSRAATGAAATWLTGRAIGFNAEGYGRVLRRTAHAKAELEQKLISALGEKVFIPSGLDLNILCFSLKPLDRLSAMNRATQALFAKSGAVALDGFSLSRTCVDLDDSHRSLREHLVAAGVMIDQDHLTLIRSCLMNPFSTTRHANVDFLSAFAMAIRRAAEPIFKDVLRV